MEFSKEFNIDTLISNLNEKHYLCMLINKEDASFHIPSSSLMQTKSTELEIVFSAQDVKEKVQSKPCFELVCSSSTTVGFEKFGKSQIPTQYCFKKNEDDCAKCNPNA